MGWSESLNYVLFQNPVSTSVISTASSVVKSVGGRNKSTTPPFAMPPVAPAVKTLFELAGANRQLVRFAGISGALAVVLGAYGSHHTNPAPDAADLKNVFDTANRFHFFHSIVLLAVPLAARKPVITGSLFIIGTSLFSGVCYYRALTGDRKYNRLAPIGGVCLLLAWASLII